MAISKVGIVIAVACLLRISESFAVKRHVPTCAGPTTCLNAINSGLYPLTLDSGNATALYLTFCNGTWRPGHGNSCEYDASLCDNSTVVRQAEVYRHLSIAMCNTSNIQAVISARGSTCFGSENQIASVTTQANNVCFMSSAAQAAWAGPPTPAHCSTLRGTVRPCYVNVASQYCGANSRDLMGLWADAVLFTVWPTCQQQS